MTPVRFRFWTPAPARCHHHFQCRFSIEWGNGCKEAMRVLEDYLWNFLLCSASHHEGPIHF
jgi:hypothetical protein